jgi:predicted DCC family thiol-disulfide oxidoreductase YuxK
VNAILSFYTRIDPRSLGLFRILFGFALMGDWASRYGQTLAFYSNEGVLPNHNHIFNLKNAGTLVWSALHAFSAPGEAAFAFWLILFFYLAFTIGWKTRAFAVLSLLSLLSLAARNTLAEGPGDWLGIALLGFAVFLPLGTRYSVDALRESMQRSRAQNDADLEQRVDVPSPEQAAAFRLTGWSPSSFAAVGLFLQIALLFLALAMQQNGPAWRDGSAISKALSVHLVASPLGASLEGSAIAGLLTRVLYGVQWLVPALVLLPIPRGIGRSLGAVLLVVHGLSYGLLFNYGLFGWAIAASSVLLITSEAWDRFTTKHRTARVRTVIYDADCGICFWMCRLLAQLDTRKELVFQGNDTLHEEEPKLRHWDEKTKTVVLVDLPSGVTAELSDRTVIVVGPDGEVHTRADAVGEVLRALPLLGWLGVLVRLPGVASLVQIAYEAFAKRRTAISTELGLAACGVPSANADTAPALPKEPPPSTKLRFRITSSVRELFAAVFLASVLVTTTQANAVGFKLPANDTLAAVSWWSRTLAQWGEVLAPEPPSSQGWMVVDAVVRSEQAVDLLTGVKPTALPSGAFTLGPQWSRYLEKIQREDFRPYQNAFKTYLGKRGPAWLGEEPNDKVLGLEVWWYTAPAPGNRQDGAERRRLFRHGRGGSDFAVTGGVVVPEAKPTLPERRTLQRPAEESEQAQEPAPPPPAAETPGEGKRDESGE